LIFATLTHNTNRYKLAEKLQDRLNELNKDLTEMIEEINNTSQTLSKTGKPDDPVRTVPLHIHKASTLTLQSLQRSFASSTPSCLSSSSSTRVPRSCRTRSPRPNRKLSASVPMAGTVWAQIPPRTFTGASVAAGRSALVACRRVVLLSKHG
jgi:hypothetical protein